MFNELRILYQSRIYPDGLSGSYLRTFNIAKLLIKKFNKITVFSSDKINSYNGIIDGIFVIQGRHRHPNSSKKLLNHYYKLISNSYTLYTLDSAFTNMQNSLFQIESPYYYNLLKKKGIDKYILNEHNVNWELMRIPSPNMKMEFYNKLMFDRNVDIEIKAIQHASHVLVCSEQDRQKILSRIPEMDGSITIIPNCININNYIDYEMTGGNKEDNVFHILFIGSLSYFPNTDAVYSICTKIAPEFTNEFKFIIIGKNPPIFDKPKNVYFLGFVEDIRKYIYEADICIAPLRYGSGTRLKIIEYMAMGKPVISTSKGAEGIDYINGENIIIEDDIDMFPERILELIGKKQKIQEIGKRAQQLIELKYDCNLFQEKLIHIYEEI